MNNVKLLVPAASDAHAYLITPGGVVPLPPPPNSNGRAPGGLEILLEDFGVTAIVLVTTNLDLINQIEQSVNKVRPQAVGLAIEQAELLRAWVGEIDAMLQDDGHSQKESAGLLNQATEYIKSAREAQERFDYQTAWNEARRVGRPLRILMRYHWMAAYDAIVKDLRDEDLPCGPTAYPGQKRPQPRIIAPMVAAPLASFNTLPKAWVWSSWIRSGRLGRNLIPSGNFNDPDTLKKGGWADVSYKTDDIATEIKLNDGGPDTEPADQERIAFEKEARRAKANGEPAPKYPRQPGTNVVLVASPKPGISLDSLVPFVDHPVVALRSPSVKVGVQQVYRISVMAYMSTQSAPGAGGLIVRDSLGGERLQFRTKDALATNWFEIVYYRRAPADGVLSVTLGMAGYGFAAFDDLKIEPIVEQVGDDDLKQLQLAGTARRKREAKDDEAKAKATAETASSADDSGLPAPASRPPAANRLQPRPIRE